MFKNSWFKLYPILHHLTQTFKKQPLQPSTSSQFHFTRHPKFNLSFDYIHSLNLQFPPLPKQNYYIYKKFPLIPQIQYQIQQIKQIHQYIKHQHQPQLYPP
ncbi:immunity protein YezG family protein [Staphylococcus aureus]|uniref:immunity protein YezG family protein n=1 Tax=Staphylococcus aureus TaxID=1280 RepID=UPI0037D9BBCD